MQTITEELMTKLDKAMGCMPPQGGPTVLSIPVRYLPSILREVFQKGFPDQEMLDTSDVRPLSTLPGLHLTQGVNGYAIRSAPSETGFSMPLSFHLGNPNIVGY